MGIEKIRKRLKEVKKLANTEDPKIVVTRRVITKDKNGRLCIESELNRSTNELVKYDPPKPYVPEKT